MPSGPGQEFSANMYRVWAAWYFCFILLVSAFDHTSLIFVVFPYVFLFLASFELVDDAFGILPYIRRDLLQIVDLAKSAMVTAARMLLV